MFRIYLMELNSKYNPYEQILHAIPSSAVQEFGRCDINKLCPAIVTGSVLHTLPLYLLMHGNADRALCGIYFYEIARLYHLKDIGFRPVHSWNTCSNYSA